MRCPRCKHPVPDHLIFCPNCKNALYEGALTSAKNFRTERVDRSKSITVRFEDPELGFPVSMHGYFYKENEGFLVIYQSNWRWEEFSWASKLNFVVIPKVLILERQD